MRDIRPLIQKMLPRLRTLRRELHQYPEIKYEEVETARRITEFLSEIPGLKILTKVAVTGVVATLCPEKIISGPCVALRSDIDALPMLDESGLPHASKIAGRAHTCGHDGHIVSLLGAALVLSEIRDELEGPVKFLFQPAEEGGAGAKRMIDEMALQDPPVAAIFGYHNMPLPDLPFGAIATREGPLMAACSMFKLRICGKAGHAAYPHLVIDPVIIGAQLITALQTIVSRTLNPVNNGVVSVTAFECKSGFTSIPAEATMTGTIRALDDAVLTKAETRLVEISNGICATFGATVEVEVFGHYPCLTNHPGCVNHVAAVANNTGRSHNLRVKFPPVMGGEDFAYYGLHVPACFYFIGSKPDAVTEVPMCHNPKFDFNDDILADAVEMHVEIARRFRTV